MFRKLFQQQKSQHDQDRRDQHPQKPPAQRKRQQKSNARPDQKQPEPLGLYTHKKSPLSAYAGRRNLCGSERVLQLPAHGLFAAGDEAAVDAALRHQRLVCAALDDLSLVHHERIPIHSAGIDILPAYYEEFPKTHYPELYFDLPAAFQSVDQATDFPAMSRLLFEIENYRGEGAAAALFTRLIYCGCTGNAESGLCAGGRTGCL